MPITVLPLQALVSEPLKPVLHHVISSGRYHAYGYQGLKGEIITGAHMDPWPTYTTHATAGYMKHQAEALIDLQGEEAGLLALQDAGLDVSPELARTRDAGLVKGKIPEKRTVKAKVVSMPFYDPKGGRLRR